MRRRSAFRRTRTWNADGLRAAAGRAGIASLTNPTLCFPRIGASSLKNRSGGACLVLGTLETSQAARGTSAYRGQTGSSQRTLMVTRLTLMYGPAVRCKRFVDLVVSGLASMYPVSSWSRFAPDHHGYQRACDLINGQASTGHRGHQCSHAPGRPILHLYLSSRRPRLETVDRVTSSLAPHIAQFLCSSQGPFLRPGPQNVDRVARRGGQGRPLRLACGGLRRCQAAP